MRTILLAAALLPGVATASSAQGAPPPEVTRAGARESRPGPAENFTGTVRVETVVTPTPPGRASVALVTFQPNARTNWHSHPAGQTLYVTEGCGWTQREGGAVRRICKGDGAYVPAGVKHWHGATDKVAMTHMAVSEGVDGRNAAWGEAVTDRQYLAGRTAR